MYIDLVLCYIMVIMSWMYLLLYYICVIIGCVLFWSILFWNYMVLIISDRFVELGVFVWVIFCICFVDLILLLI